MRTKPPKIIKWEPWAFQLDLLDLFLTEIDIVIIKARQLGISWLVSGYVLWQTLFSNSAKCLFFSQGEKEAWELVRKSKFIFDKLPSFLKLEFEHNSRGWLSFSGNDSEMVALASTDKAGRSTDATILIRDELAYHEYAKDNFAAVGPTVDSGGQSIDLSTIDKEAGPDNYGYHFKERVLEAKEGATYDEVWPSGIRVIKGGCSGATLVFLGRWLRPTRREGMTNKEWFDLIIKPKYKAIKLESEYPETLEEALKTPETTAFFDRPALNEMELNVIRPINTIEIATYNGVVRIYKLPVVGKTYVLFTDPSDGIEDPFCSIVLDANTGECVASAHGMFKADRCGKVHDELARIYGAYHSFDINATAGGKFDETLNNLQTPRLMPRYDEYGKIQEGKRGYQINERIRNKMLDGLEEAVRRHLIICHDREAINEMTIFSRINGKTQAPRGMHDDYVMALAGAWFLTKHVPKGELKITSGKYKG